MPLYQKNLAPRETGMADTNFKEATRQTNVANKQKSLVIQNEKAARTQEALAKEETAVAQRNERESKARELAAFLTASLSEDPEKSILLGMQALNASLPSLGQAPVPAAEGHCARAILSSQVRMTLRGDSEVVAGVAFSPDGKRIATASWDKTAKVSEPCENDVVRNC